MRLSERERLERAPQMRAVVQGFKNAVLLLLFLQKEEEEVLSPSMRARAQTRRGRKGIVG